MDDMVRKLQYISYCILCDVDDFCRKNNIRYFLGGGSALGAVRHKGFIPWDDDIDIMMPREDYDRFLATFGDAVEYQGRYELGSLSNTPGWTRPFARVWDKRTKMSQNSTGERDLGVLIDIFPIDGVPEGKLARKIFYLRLRIANTLRNAAQRQEFLPGERHRTLKKILHVFAAVRGARYYAEKLDRIARKHEYSKCSVAGASLAVHYWGREALDKKHFEGTVYMPFATREFPLPVGYHEYLTSLYGDYMVIPQDDAERGHTHLDRWRIEIGDEVDFSQMDEVIGQ